MAELARAKAAVKEWERAFRREAGRAPTKDDIRADPGDIAEQYALYRRLTKAKEGSGGSVNGAGAEPTTPTPRRRGPARRASPPSPGRAAGAAGPSSSKRPAPVPAPNAPVTPQNKRIRYGPAVDPLPNPFSVTPKKGSSLAPVSPFKRSTAGARGNDHHDSPFIFATSPRKLKDVLEANSLRKNRERLAAGAGARAGAGAVPPTPTPPRNTPRTRARRRLAGESVESPVTKLKPRRRGLGGVPAAAPAAGVFDGAAPSALDDHGDDDDGDDDEEFEETPLKAGVFALVDEAPKAAAGTSRGRDLFPMFRKAADALAAGSTKPAVTAAVSARPNGKRKGRGETERAPKRPRSSSTAPVSDAASGAASDAGVPDEAMYASAYRGDGAADAPSTPPPAAPPRPQRTPRRDHVVTLSEDEWDPEATPRTLRITGTRRAAVAVAADVLASDDEESAEGEQREEDGDGEWEDVDGGSDAPSVAGDAAIAASAGADDDPRALLSLLSLRSPVARSGERLADLRVRALLDPTSAAAVALRAMQRGQDVWACGETGDDDDDDDGFVLANDDAGDDDWESDPEGWKAVPADDDW